MLLAGSTGRDAPFLPGKSEVEEVIVSVSEPKFEPRQGRKIIVNYENAFFCNFIIFLYFSVIYGII